METCRLSSSLFWFAVRSKRPNVEQTRDFVHGGLMNEINEISSSQEALKNQIACAEETLHRLMKNKERLQQDIAIKKKSIQIDEQQCLRLRKTLNWRGFRPAGIWELLWRHSHLVCVGITPGVYVTKGLLQWISRVPEVRLAVPDSLSIQMGPQRQTGQIWTCTIQPGCRFCSVWRRRPHLSALLRIKSRMAPPYRFCSSTPAKHCQSGKSYYLWTVRLKFDIFLVCQLSHRAEGPSPKEALSAEQTDSVAWQIKCPNSFPPRMSLNRGPTLSKSVL
eukprot:sb/3467995/